MLSDWTASYTPGISEKGAGVSTFFSGGIKNTDTQTDASQAVTASRLYDAFGNVIASTATWKSPFGNAGKFGYQEDPDTGLKLLGHRYFDSSTGRFLTRDPAKEGRNWYGYCGNSPVGNFDDGGEFTRPINPNDIPFTWADQDYSEGPDAGKIAKSEGNSHTEATDCGIWVRSIFTQLGVEMPDGPANTWAEWFKDSGDWEQVPHDGKHLKSGDIIVITRPGKKHGHIMIVGSDGIIYAASLDQHRPRSARKEHPSIEPITDGGRGGKVTIWRHKGKRKKKTLKDRIGDWIHEKKETIMVSL